jgi:hypothetical protein
VSGFLPMTDPDHGFVGSKGIVTLICTYPSRGP